MSLFRRTRKDSPLLLSRRRRACPDQRGSNFRRSRTASALTARRHQAGSPHFDSRACPAVQPSQPRPREQRCR